MIELAWNMTTERLAASVIVLALGAAIVVAGMKTRFRFLVGIGIWVGAVGLATVAVNYRTETALTLDTWVAVPMAIAATGICILLAARLLRRTQNAG